MNFVLTSKKSSTVDWSSRVVLLVLLMTTKTQAFGSPTRRALFSGSVSNERSLFSSTAAELETSAFSTAPAPTSASTRVSWQIRKAVDTDMTLVSDFLDLKCAFDRSLNGQKEGEALKTRIGYTLGTLFPELAHAQVLLASTPQPQPSSSVSWSADSTLSSPPPPPPPTTGFCSYALRWTGLGTPPLLWMEDLFVNPALRSQGAGQALMQELANRGQAAGCSHMEWKVDERNTQALAFYHRLGATVTGQKGSLQKMEWIPAAW